MAEIVYFLKGSGVMVERTSGVNVAFGIALAVIVAARG